MSCPAPPPGPPPPGHATTVARKADHIRIGLERNVAARGVDPGFDRFRFIPCTLPEIDLDQVETGTEVFGRRLAAPILVSCMTGGTPAAQAINRTLAEAAQRFRLAMGLGSGRVLLERPEVLPTFQVRAFAPDVLLLANLGAVQLNCGVGVDDCRRLVEMLDADALVLHLNALQEALQPEGDGRFGGLLSAIAVLCREMPVPIVAKEVGWGIDGDTVRRLFDAGVGAVDVAGAGGTSWSEVERHRMPESWRARVAEVFAGWGLPTVDALRMARRVAPDRLVFASGGVRTGMDVAKAVALGADVVGVAHPFLRAAAESRQAVEELAMELLETLRITMFCVGAARLGELRGTRRLVAAGEPAGGGERPA